MLRPLASSEPRWQGLCCTGRGDSNLLCKPIHKVCILCHCNNLQLHSALYTAEREFRYCFLCLFSFWRKHRRLLGKGLLLCPFRSSSMKLWNNTCSILDLVLQLDLFEKSCGYSDTMKCCQAKPISQHFLHKRGEVVLVGISSLSISPSPFFDWCSLPYKR